MRPGAAVLCRVSRVSPTALEERGSCEEMAVKEEKIESKGRL